MHVKFLLPALTEARSIFWRSLKYSLFPPLGLATLAAYLDPEDSAEIGDDHVENLTLDDKPDIVAIEVYITAARRAYAIADHYRAKGCFVVMGGLHPTALPGEALEHADAVVLGPAEQAWPRFLADFRAGRAQRVYRSEKRTLEDLPMIRRDLIARARYLVPNSLVVSRGCPYSCSFCYKTGFFQGGKGFYTVPVDRALREITGLPGRHLFFLDDNILGHPGFARELLEAMRGMNRVWQGASTVNALADEALLDLAVQSGLRSLFIGFESLSRENLRQSNKRHNLRHTYERAIRELHDRGVMINASFVFGLDDDDPDVFARTVDWAIANSLETATFHILTPYPGTALFTEFERAGRIQTRDWDLYDTRHAVFRHPRMTAQQLERGYWQAYEQFYRWGSILQSARGQSSVQRQFRHFAYSAGWKKCEPLWTALIRLKQIGLAIPLLETVLERGRG